MTQQPDLKQKRHEKYIRGRKKKGLKSRAEFWIEQRFKLIFGDNKDGV